VTFDSPVTRSIPSNSIDYWQFTGTESQLFTIAALRNQSDLMLSLIVLAPDNTQIFADDGAGMRNPTIPDMALPQAGTFTVEVINYGSTEGSYTLTMIDLIAHPPTPSPTRTPRTIKGALTYGDTVTGVLQPYQIDSWRFDAIAGQIIAIAMTKNQSDLDSLVRILGSDGAELMSDDESGDTHDALISHFAITQTGSYIITAGGYNDSSGAYALTLTLERFARRMGDAHIGENTSQISIGGSDIWTYNGHAGEMLTVGVKAEYPVNTADIANWAGLLDTVLTLRTSDGMFEEESNDIEVSVLTDSLINDVVLPSDGVYEIEIGSYDNRTGGAYTLVIQSNEVSSATETP
jgi:hypothetical protein